MDDDWEAKCNLGKAVGVIYLVRDRIRKGARKCSEQAHKRAD